MSDDINASLNESARVTNSLDVYSSNQQQPRPKAKPKQKAKGWTKTIGEYGASLRLYEDPNSGIIYYEHRGRCASLRHRDKKAAERWAKEQVGKWMAGESQDRDPTPTCARVFSLYLQHQSPNKSKSEQKADQRRAAMWCRWLGPDKDMRLITLNEWNSFITARTTRVINPKGETVSQDKADAVNSDDEPAKTVGPSTVAGDLTFLRTVLNFAVKWQTEDGRYLLRENCTRGFAMPSEKNPRRPVATHDRFLALRAVADKVMMVRGHRSKTPEIVQSYFGPVLELAEGTGRRISSILALRYCDLKLSAGGEYPHGSILWPAATDKMKKQWLVPMTTEIRAVIDGILRERPGIGTAFLFPSVNDSTKPVSLETANVWHLKAEKLAGLPKLNGSLWHCFRRKFACERKHLPLPDVAASGGWTDTTVLLNTYQQPDPATMLEVMNAPARLRDVK